VYFFIPYFDNFLHEEGTLAALSWSGYNAWISPAAQDIFAYTTLFFYVVASIGLINFKTWSKTFFVVLTIFSILSELLFGFSAITAYDAMLLDIVGILDGAILAMLYFTSISNEFDS